MVKRLSVLSAAAAGLLLCASAAFGGGASARFPIAFDLSGATCSQLAPNQVIHGTGNASFFVTSNGNIHVVITGTATDGAGGFWRFNYADNMRPLGGGAVEVTDQFNLVGSGSPIKVHTHFVAEFTSSDLESADLLGIKQVHGDPFACDPI